MAILSALKNRNIYLNRLIEAQDTRMVKVITGIRRSGKSSLLKLMLAHLRQSGIQDDQILEMNFESYEYAKMSGEYFFHYVRNRICKGKRTYLFFDELQIVPEWAEQISAFMVAFDCDIYISGSNASLLSTEFNSYLAKKSIVICIYPLTFAECIEFYGFSVSYPEPESSQTPIGLTDAQGQFYPHRRAIEAFLRYGGMPILSEVRTAQQNFQPYLDGVYSTIILRDILERERERGQQLIKDPALLKKIILYMADQIGRPLSVSSIGNALVNEGLLFEGTRQNVPSVHTVQAYVSALIESYLFYEVKRFDIRTNEPLRTLGSFYMADPGLRNYLLGFDSFDRAPALRNVVFTELIARGYTVMTGKIGSQTVDFIATKNEEKIYYQVVYSMEQEEIRTRTLSPLKKIRDNYAKIVLSLEPDPNRLYEGIRSIPLISWLLH